MIKTISIDTSTIIANNYNFEQNGKYVELQKLAKDGYIRILITDIVAKEVEANIIKSTKGIEEKIKKFSNDQRILKNYPPLNDFFNQSHTESDITSSILEKFKRFLKNGKVKVLSSKKVCDENIINAYFDGSAPFKPKGEIAEKSNDKRFEFPDAISLSTIEKWADKNKTKVFIVSNDDGWKEKCKDNKFLISTDLAQFIADAQENSKKYFEKKIKCKIQKLIPEITKQLEEHYKDSGEFFIEEYEGEVTATNNYQFSNIQTSLLELNQEEGKVSVWFSANMTVDIDVSYGDTDTASYDSEDKNLIIHNWVETTWDTEIWIEAKVELHIEDDEIDILDVIDQTPSSQFNIQNPDREHCY